MVLLKVFFFFFVFSFCEYKKLVEIIKDPIKNR